MLSEKCWGSYVCCEPTTCSDRPFLLPFPTAATQTPTTSPTPSPTVPQPPLAEYKKCPTPYQLGTEYDDIGYIVARTYDSQDQEPKCEAPGTNNGPPGGPVDANSLDTQNIISCQRQDVAGAAAAPSRHRCCQLYPRSLSAVFL